MLKKVRTVIFLIFISIISCKTNFNKTIVNAQSRSSEVTVGYAELPGFLYSEGNSYNGLAYDLLQEIAVYNDWTYNFVKTTYDDALSLLNSNSIDFFVPYQKTPEREELYEYSNNIFCTNSASLLALPQTDIYFNDFEHMKNIKIGSVDNTRNNQRFEEFLNLENNCNVTIDTSYANQDELIKALNSHEIDAFICASNRGIKDCKIISTLEKTYSYAIGKKGEREFVDKIDMAIERINLNDPSFIDMLNEKNQVSESGAYPSLTRKEATYIQNHPQINVLISQQECDADGNFTDSAKVFYEQLTKLTGFSFNAMPSYSSEKLLSDLASGQGDIMYSFVHDYKWANEKGVWLTSKYFDFYNQVVSKKEIAKVRKVGVVNGTYIEYYIKNYYDYELVYYNTYEECINKVLDGTIDATYCSSPIGNYYSTFGKYTTLSFITAYDFKVSYCLGVSKHADPILVDILNKTIKCIPEKMLAEAYDSQIRTNNNTFSNFFYSNIGLSITLIILTIFVIVVVFCLLLYSIISKKKNLQLIQANNAKTEFLSRMSHDMRTPMNAILGLTNLSKNENKVEVVKDNLTQIEIAGKYLLELINDTLDMNKIESGKLQLRIKPVSGHAIFDSIIINSKILAEEKGINFIYSIPNITKEEWIPVYADGPRIEQVLMNVISNGIKYTNSGGTVSFKMENISKTDDEIVDRYIVTDNGIGMSPEFIPHMFEPFSQEGRTKTNREEGTGIGMAIVKKLLELMGGEIKVESELNFGTEVTIIMKYKVCKELSDVEEKSTLDLSVLANKRVLLCEDHPINAKIACQLLEKKGMIIEIAEDGQIGVEKFKNSPLNYYDIILMDIKMPKVNGLEACKMIRELKRMDATTIPIIAMTANAFKEDIVNCLNSGMNEHIAKPIDVNKLYNVLAKFISELQNNK